MQSCFFLSLLFAGCSIGPDYHPPEVRLPSGWHAADPSSHQQTNDEWWTVFHSPTLNQLMVDAFRENLPLQAAAQRLREARALARMEESEFLPDIHGSPSYSRTRLSSNRANPVPFPVQGFTHDTFRVPFDLSYEIDIWGRVRRSFEASRAEVGASEAEQRALRLTLSADVARIYFQVRSLDSKKIIHQQWIAGLRDAVEIKRERQAAGLIHAAETAQAEIHLATTEAELPEIIRQREEGEHALAVLCGKNPQEFSLPPEPLDLLPPSIPPGLPSEVLARRPDIMESERLVAAASARIGVAQAAFLPSIHLTGSAGFESAELTSLLNWDSRIWTYGPTIQIPIFRGGRNTANLKAVEARYEQAVLQYRQKALTAFQEVEDTLSSLRKGNEEAQALSRAVTASRENTRLIRLRHEAGLVNRLAVLEAGESQLQQERSAIHCLGYRLTQTILLIKSLGGGWDVPVDKNPDSEIPVQETH